MGDFTKFRDQIQKHFKEMQGADRLFEVRVNKDEMYNLYLDSFPRGENPFYRKRREYDCSACRAVIKNIGAAITIQDGKIDTIWNIKNADPEYQPVLDAMDSFIRSQKVTGLYTSKIQKIGYPKSYESVNGGAKKWDHLCVELPQKWVLPTSATRESICANYRDIRNVFKRSLDEITMDSLDTVLELIESNTLYRGAEWKAILKKFRDYKKAYSNLSSEREKELFTWEKSGEAGATVGKIRNHSIGTLLINLSENEDDLESALRKYEHVVAPSNYKRPKAVFTKKMLESAKKTLSDLGYLDSLQRRFATLDDITVNNILFSNKDAAKRISGADDIFGEMEKEVTISPKKFSRVEEISAQDFIDKVLPTANEVEAFVENKHLPNLVSLIAPINPDAKSMFKWNNALSWAYAGNITDSSIRENVKAAGGKVDGVLRFSIQWNDNQDDNSDLDAHCIEPNGNEIYFGKRRGTTGGVLDIDITHPKEQRPGVPAVENIVWENSRQMIPGKYRFFVNQYSARGSKGFSAEIAFNGETYSFSYPHPVSGNIDVANVIVSNDKTFKIEPILPATSGGIVREEWGLKTNQFIPVSVISYSPNYFDEQEGIGHRHLFFFLNGCKNPEEPNGYYNEFLKNELDQHKRVLEALGSKCHVANADDQLSGIGFSMTKRADLIVKVKGATERVMKIRF